MKRKWRWRWRVLLAALCLLLPSAVAYWVWGEILRVRYEAAVESLEEDDLLVNWDEIRSTAAPDIENIAVGTKHPVDSGAVGHSQPYPGIHRICPA